MRQYFTNRKNRESISQERTGGWDVSARGCPQGSAVRPLLWDVFQNEVHFATDKKRLFMYVDNHQLFSVAKTAYEVVNILSDEGNNISKFYNINILQGNF